MSGEVPYANPNYTIVADLCLKLIFRGDQYSQDNFLFKYRLALCNGIRSAYVWFYLLPSAHWIVDEVYQIETFSTCL